MDKIKAFFNNTIVKVISWIVLALDVVSLILGGATKVDIDNGIGLILGVVGAVAALIVFISGKIKKE